MTAGLEPQRLSFGSPENVQTLFADRIKSCWFTEGGILPAGFSYQLAENDDGNGSPHRLIRIYDETSGRAEAFQVHFYPHNDNTMIATRNVGLPPSLALELEVSIETWLLDPGRCRRDEVADPSAQLHTTGLSQGDRAAAADRDGAVQAVDVQAHKAEGDEAEEDMHTAELKARGAID